MTRYQVIRNTTRSAEKSLIDLPNEILLQIMQEVGAESIPTLFRLLRICKTAWRTWHGVDPAIPTISQERINPSERYRQQMKDLMRMAVAPALYPALFLAWATKELMLKRRMADRPDRPLRDSLDDYFHEQSPQSPLLPNDFGLEHAHEIQTLDRATAGLADLFFQKCIDEFLSKVRHDFWEEKLESHESCCRAIMPMDGLERHRIQRALCMHEHFRCIEQDAPGSFNEASLDWFSKTEVAQLLTVSDWLRQSIARLTPYVEHNRPGVCRNILRPPYSCPKLKALRLVLHPVTILRLLTQLQQLDTFRRNNDHRDDVILVLKTESDLNRPDPHDETSMVQIDLDALFASDCGIPPDRDPHEQLEGLSEGDWILENDQRFESGHHHRGSHRFDDPDPGPCKYVLQDEEYMTLTGKHFHQYFLFYNQERRDAALKTRHVSTGLSIRRSTTPTSDTD